MREKAIEVCYRYKGTLSNTHHSFSYVFHQRPPFKGCVFTHEFDLEKKVGVREDDSGREGKKWGGVEEE